MTVAQDSFRNTESHPALAVTPAYADSPLYNADLAPTTAAQRTWRFWSIAALWISMSACIPTYTLASSLIDQGMSWWQAVLTIFAGNAVVLVPMILNGFAGTKYGIPFPVYCRASFGTRGANLPAMLRALVACGWFGIQTWIGGTALLAIAAAFKPELVDAHLHIARHGVTGPQFTCFMIFWAINMAVILAGIESIRILLNVKAPLLIGLGLLLLGWATYRAHGFGQMFHDPGQFAPGHPKAGQFWAFFFPALTGVVGFWATLSLNIPDFTRYAASQKDQIYGQALGLPPTMALYSFIGVAVTSATVVIFGHTIWDPVVLLSTFHSKTMIVIAMGSIAIATLATNIAANVVSPANDFSNLAPRFIGFRLGGIITGIIGVAIMPWYLYNDPSGYIFTWLIGSSSLLGAVGGVLICDYWVLRRGRLNLPGLFEVNGPYTYDRGFNWCAVIACAIAVVPVIPGFIDTVTTNVSTHHSLFDPTSAAGAVLHDLYNYSWFVTFGLSFVIYAVLMIGRDIEPANNAGFPVVMDQPTKPSA